MFLNFNNLLHLPIPLPLPVIDISSRSFQDLSLDTHASFFLPVRRRMKREVKAERFLVTSRSYITKLNPIIYLIKTPTNLCNALRKTHTHRKLCMLIYHSESTISTSKFATREVRWDMILSFEIKIWRKERIMFRYSWWAQREFCLKKWKGKQKRGEGGFGSLLDI